MADVTPARAGELLAEADRRGMFQKHRVSFGATPSIRPVVDRTAVNISVKLSDRLRGMPEDALKETLQNVISRIYDPDLPRFGRRAVSYMQSEAFVHEMCRRARKEDRFALNRRAPQERLDRSLKRILKMLPDPFLQIRIAYLDLGWRRGTSSLKEDYIASTDSLGQCIRVDSRLAPEEMPTVLLDYVVFREVCALCAFDHTYGRVDVSRYEELAGRFPDGTMMSGLCMELGWAFTVPLETEADA